MFTRSIKSIHYSTIFGQADFHPGKLFVRTVKLSSNRKLYTVFSKLHLVYDIVVVVTRFCRSAFPAGFQQTNHRT